MIEDRRTLCYEYVAPMRTSKQLVLSFAKVRAKRRSRLPAAGVPHRARPPHCHRHPVHVTLRRRGLLPSLREEVLFLAIRRGISRSARSWFRVLHFSVQANHIHMMVEARDKLSLSRGITGLSVRIARAFNGALGRRGGLWSDRFHSRALRTPREVRNGLVYILMNHRKHAGSANLVATRVFDVCSSAWWFTGWARPPPSAPPLPTEVPPVAPPQTWLAQTGWKRHGLIRADESPARR
jgi:putative transposase